jgi:hypothetical protein
MPEFVVYRGIRMAEGWPEEIRAAQTKTTLVMDGQTFRRIPYGRERGWGPGPRRECHDCCVLSGELHVPGCDMERCPSCGGQLLTCGCQDEEEREQEE